MEGMDPVSVSIETQSSRADTYAFLDVLANHESFTDHMLRDRACSGPSAGVGARAESGRTNLRGEQGVDDDRR